MSAAHPTEQNNERAHRLQQEKHKLQAALREALRWVAHQHTSSATHEQRWQGSKTLNVIKTILSQHDISESDVDYLLQLSRTTSVMRHDEKTLTAFVESMIKKIQQTTPTPHTLDHTPHLLQSITLLQQQISHLWKLNAQLWEENQYVLEPIEHTASVETNPSKQGSTLRRHFDGASTQRKLHQLIREKTQLVEQLGRLQNIENRQWPNNNESRQQLNYLRAENLSLLRKFHEANTRATQLEQVLHLNREAWVCTNDYLPPSSDIYWISDGETVWRSFFNAKLEAFEDSPGGFLPTFWMPIIKPCPPLHSLRN